MTEKGAAPAPNQVDFSALNETLEKLQPRQEDLFRRDLEPYANDDAFLIGRMSEQNNRLLRRAPELKSRIEAAFMADDDESLIQLSDDINRANQLHSPMHQKPINTILSFISFTEVCNVIRVELNNEEHIKPRLNVFYEYMYRQIADSFPEELLDDAYLSTDFLISRIQGMYDAMNYPQPDKVTQLRLSALNNMRIRLGGLSVAVKTRHDSFLYVDGLPGDNMAESVSQQEVEDDSRRVAELFSSIRATQRYGVKMGYIREEELGGALVFSPTLSAANFSDSKDLQSIYHPLLDKTEVVAQVLHTQRENHRYIKPKRDEDRGYTTVGFDDLGPSIAFNLAPDGELYTWRDCKTSLRDIALQKGKYPAYRQLQATVIAHYFDLTHPLEEVLHITKALKEYPLQLDPSTRPAVESIERLVVPRVLLYAEQTTPGQSAEQQQIQEDNESIRMVRRHNVTWHVRKLPEGWHPSPAAIQLARQLGIKLNPHETVVKEHKRGSAALGEVVAHRFVDVPPLRDNEE